MTKPDPCPRFPHKIVHRTQEAARKAIAALERAGKMDQLTETYPCRDHWHVGHKPRPARRRQIQNTLRIGRAKYLKATTRRRPR